MKKSNRVYGIVSIVLRAAFKLKSSQMLATFSDLSLGFTAVSREFGCTKNQYRSCKLVSSTYVSLPVQLIPSLGLMPS
ncbi:unnamed protein product [Allacma fusca]|uniref:Uncharacterized protein n=1 Tax=Allacma fusca TaxID=39272 RepID=A0A8J2NGY9_9HEXA|nr:unnamed protein product [Allacma fusca]